MFFKDSDSCFYIKCVADSTQDNNLQSTSNAIMPTLREHCTSNKRQHFESNFGSPKLKVIRCSEASLDNIDAALLSAEKCLEQIDKVSNTQNSSLLNKKKISNIDASSNNTDDNRKASKISKDQNNTIKKTPFEQSSNNNSSKRLKIDDPIERTSTLNSTENNNDKLYDSVHSTLPIAKVTPDLRSKTRNSKQANRMQINTIKIDFANIENTLPNSDTAYITIPLILDNKNDVSFSYITTDDKAKSFIIEGKMIKLNDKEVDAYNPSEIDSIIDDAIIHGVHFYLVKWKNWSLGFNTWEQFNVLYKSQKLVLDFARKKSMKNSIKSTVGSKPVNGLHLILSRKIITHLFNSFRTEAGLSIPLISPEDMSNLFNGLDLGPKQIQINRTKTLELNLATISLSYYRQKQLINLKQWEIDINLMIQGYKIKVENNIDLEGPPDYFVYSTNYVPHNNVKIPNDPPIGCNCKKNCQLSDDCCNNMSGYSAVYDLNKTIIISPGYPIFECNKKCKCTSECNNRVVQLGSKVNVCIYKTSLYGWAVKTTQNIKKGQFVSQYIGEIITVNESEQRLENNSSSLDYMWNLDFDDINNYKYIIDGSHYANFTYFINHSCNANLNVYAVWINCLDRNLPQLALFASRDILAGEQLTTDYFSRCPSESLKKTGIKCQCKMKNCKGYFF